MVSKIINPNIGSYKAVNTDHAVSAVGKDIVIGHEPEDSGDRIWVLDAIQYSYKNTTTNDPVLSAAPITGGLTVMVGNKVKWDADIPDLTGVLNLYIPGQTDKPITVTLKAGGAKVIGKLNCQWHLEPAS